MTLIAPETSGWEQYWLPRRPLATNDFRAGLHRENRPVAMKRRYVEANPRALSNLLVVDIDHEDSLLRALWARQAWLPNAVVENPDNGHAHAVWALSEPVTRTEYARRKPLAYAAAVTEGLRRSVDGDIGYSGLITKNPLHDAWNTSWHADRLYSLDELAHHLTEDGFMPPASWKRARRKAPVGLSRNCDIFESARIWAYRAARLIRQRSEHPTPQDSRDLFAAIHGHVKELNAEYSEPLPASEIRASARSIHRWITTKFYGWTDSRTVNEATFTAMQSARGRKSGLIRRGEKLDLVEQTLKKQAPSIIQPLHKHDLSYREEKLDLVQRTIKEQTR